MKISLKNAALALGLLLAVAGSCLMAAAPQSPLQHWLTSAAGAVLTWVLGYSSAQIVESGKSLRHLRDSERFLADATRARQIARSAHEAHFRTIEVLRLIEADRDFERATEYLKSIQDSAH